eukprot:TRINITY_DN3805_c0_g1_i1.p1 TRINITY_DN3805_c0_g1~~TRINITY_DN3805_c0_g1_i1.p1  ORF type:complete len:258 (-),score=74.59 TRINITY_DN3805_c0_g1_i1:112-885(-)
MSSGREIVSPEGLRSDGRRSNEIRKISCKLGLLSSTTISPLASRPDGSASFHLGNTKAYAQVFGPREVAQRSKAQSDRALINVDYSFAPFCSTERKRKIKGDRRLAEQAITMRQTFEAAVLVGLYPRSQIDIFVQIIQADGGERCAAVNAITLALIDAGIPMSEFVVSCSAGITDSLPILDLNYMEISASTPELSVSILPNSGNITAMQMDSRIPPHQFEKIVNLASDGCRLIHDVIKKEVEQYTLDLVEARGIHPS